MMIKPSLINRQCQNPSHSMLEESLDNTHGVCTMSTAWQALMQQLPD